LPPVEEAAEVLPRAVQARPAAGRRINLRGVRVWDWFEAHENYGRLVDEERGVHAVRCPWEDGHSSGRGAEDTDTVVFDGRDGRPPAFDCKHSSCVDRRLRDVQDLWADAREFGATVDYPLNDDGNGQRLVDAHGEDFRYSKALGLLLWDGRRWNRGRDGEVEAAVRELARQVIRSIYDELSAIPDGTRQQVFSHARKSGNQERIVAMVKSATDSRSIQVTADQFDQDPWALNFLNGTVDLRTGERRDHRREDYLTRCLPHPYEPSATCPRFDQFMSEVFAGDQEVVEFVWRAIGYTLTGSVREQVLFFLYGSGSNGKSTLLEVLQRLLENYGGTAAPGLLMESKGDRHPTEVADLKGKRLVACVETGEGKQLAEELIKRLTGGDKMKGRFMRQDFFEFDPTHKLWLSSNHKPVIKGTDYAIWRRIPLIPFEVTFKDAKQAQPGEPVKDPNLLEVLLSEATGILAKAVRYAQDWYQNGLQTPQKVRAATEEYRSEMDIFGQFLEECCSLEDPQGEAQRDDIIQEFNRWCQRTGVRGNYGKNFVARSLGEKGVNYRKSGSRYFYQGIRLLSLAEQSVNRRELAEGIR
jgi:putative DNA primase/helicase